MKKVSILLTMLTIALTMSAQQQNTPIHKQGMMKANPEMMKSQLTDDQQKQIADLKLKHQKETLQLNNEINEKTAQLKTLQQIDKPNLKDINSKIDEISALQNKKMKAMAAHRNSVRSLLTEEQRVQFDLRMGKGGMQGKMGKMDRMEKMGKMRKMDCKDCKMEGPKMEGAPMAGHGMMHKEAEASKTQTK
jgi:Spy/CpxP family protein refolding chaperone